jgi:hypothetical protein
MKLCARRLCGGLMPALLAAALLLSSPTGDAAAQDVEEVAAPEARPSPLMLARTTLDDGTYVKIHYGSPRKRDRVLFGELVPYGELWRTAANEGSELTVTQEVTFGGEPLPAGTYTLFTIPGEAQWTVILNSGLGQNGTGGYDPGKDVVRVDVPAETTNQMYEAFTIDFEEAAGGADLVMRWDQTRVAVPIRTE